MVKMTKFMLSKYISLLNQASKLFECRIIYGVKKVFKSPSLFHEL